MSNTFRPAFDQDTVTAIHQALDDEYKARATYAAILRQFGPVQPFLNIIAAEERHAVALERLLRRAGMPVPPDLWAGQVLAPASLQEALQGGIDAEIDNAALYDRLETMTAEPAVLRVFSRLRQASQDRHLPAFRRALAASRGGLSRTPSCRPPARPAHMVHQEESRQDRAGAGCQRGGCGGGRGAGYSAWHGTGHGAGHGAGHRGAGCRGHHHGSAGMESAR